VIQITTKRGRAGGPSLTYDGYTSTASQSKKLDLLTAQEYKDFASRVGASTANILSSNTDWQDAVARTAFSQSHNLSFSAGSEFTQYLVSLNYLDEEGILLNSERSRISGRINVDHSALIKIAFGRTLQPPTSGKIRPYRRKTPASRWRVHQRLQDEPDAAGISEQRGYYDIRIRASAIGGSAQRNR
jgi:iron complex outermembrane receptor protein